MGLEIHALVYLSCSYGLAASVFSRSKSRADKIARQLRCGTVCVNDFGVAYLAQVGSARAMIFLGF